VKKEFIATMSEKKKVQKRAPDPRIPQVARKFRRLRKEAGYSSSEKFSYANDLSRTYYGHIENGVNLTLESILRLIDIHKISLEEFFKGIDSE